MATYSSKPVTLNAATDDVYAKISDFSVYQDKLNQLPDDLKAQVGQVRFTPDSIIITAAPVGDIEFEVSERIAPSTVALQAKNSPVPMILRLNLKPLTPVTTEVTSVIDVEIPMALKPFVGGKMQEAADKFADLIAKFFAGA